MSIAKPRFLNHAWDHDKIWEMNKTRLTITIDPGLLSRIDNLIDGKDLRNRSQAIEHLLEKQFASHINQAVILVGGEPDAISRSLKLISGQPLIRHLINLLKSYGISRIFITSDRDIFKLNEVISEHDGVTLIKEPKPLGTAGALANLKKELHSQPFIVMHGDIFTDINLADLVGFFQSQQTSATIAIKPALHQREFGTVIVQGSRINRFVVKPEKKGVGMVNTGVYVLNPEIISHLKTNQHTMLETEVFPELAKNRQLSGYIFDGIWYDVSKKHA